MASNDEKEVKDVEETEVETEVTDTDSTDWKAEAIKLREKARAQRETTKELKSKLAELETKAPEKKSDFGLLERTFLKASGYSDPDEVEILKKWQKDTGKDIVELVDHPFIKAEITNLRATKANQLATTNIRGDSKENDKEDVEAWLAKDEIPEGTPKKLRQKFLTEKLRRAKDGSSGGKFYNDK